MRLSVKAVVINPKTSRGMNFKTLKVIDTSFLPIFFHENMSIHNKEKKHRVHRGDYEGQPGLRKAEQKCTKYPEHNGSSVKKGEGGSDIIVRHIFFGNALFSARKVL